MLIASYADLKRCLENVYQELLVRVCLSLTPVFHQGSPGHLFSVAFFLIYFELNSFTAMNSFQLEYVSFQGQPHSSVKLYGIDRICKAGSI